MVDALPGRRAPQPNPAPVAAPDARRPPPHRRAIRHLPSTSGSTAKRVVTCGPGPAQTAREQRRKGEKAATSTDGRESNCRRGQRGGCAGASAHVASLREGFLGNKYTSPIVAESAILNEVGGHACLREGFLGAGHLLPQLPPATPSDSAHPPAPQAQPHLDEGGLHRRDSPGPVHPAAGRERGAEKDTRGGLVVSCEAGHSSPASVGLLREIRPADGASLWRR